jgi:hypothetical protein
MPKIILEDLNTSSHPLPDRVLAIIAECLPKPSEAKVGDVVAVTFRYKPGRYDSSISTHVTALVRIKGGLDDIAWDHLESDAQARVSKIAMSIFAALNGDIDYLADGISEAWPDEDEPDGVEVHVFRGARLTLPIGTDDRIAYGDDDVHGALLLNRAESNHAKLERDATQEAVLKLLKRCYKVRLKKQKQT